MTPIRILIADDSVVSRQMLKTLLEQAPGLEVAAVASNGRLALERIVQYKPDVVILDVEMPEMNGLETLREIRRLHGALPVIMFSAMTEAGAEITIQALSLGADDYVTKPSTRDRQQQEVSAQILDAFVPRIKALHARHRPALIRPAEPVTAPASQVETPIAAQRIRALQLLQRVEIVGIGVSTGGPTALAELIPSLPGDLPVPVLLVQHMPPMFTRYLAQRLNEISAVRVVEAEDGMPLEAGCVYVAPGGYHLDLLQSGDKVCTRLSTAPPENSCRPAVDVTFRAMALHYGAACLGVVMTGMGADGLRGCEALSACGGQILAQDEATSTIWSMPAYVAKAGLADSVLPLSALGPEIARRVSQAR